jgi:hypothetical protein
METPDENIYVSSVAGEFRRIELFVSGTVPNKTLLPTTEETETEVETTQVIPNSTPTPFTTWQEAQQNERGNQNPAQTRKLTPDDIKQNITVMICPLTGMRATSNCR